MMLNKILGWMGMVLVPKADIEKAQGLVDGMVGYMDRSGHLLNLVKQRPKAVVRIVRKSEELKIALHQLTA
jgi:hypothetical protein